MKVHVKPQPYSVFSAPSSVASCGTCLFDKHFCESAHVFVSVCLSISFFFFKPKRLNASLGITNCNVKPQLDVMVVVTVCTFVDGYHNHLKAKYLPSPLECETQKNKRCKKSSAFGSVVFHQTPSRWRRKA